MTDHRHNVILPYKKSTDMMNLINALALCDRHRNDEVHGRPWRILVRRAQQITSTDRPSAFDV